KKETSKKSPFFLSYLITDPIEFGSDIKIFSKNLTKSLSKHNVDIVCFRDKTTNDIEPLAKVCIDICKRFKIPKVLINSNIELALKLKFDGVHLTSTQFNNITTAKEKNLFTIISTHTEEEIQNAIYQNTDAITYSPIFFKKNKNKPIGIDKLKSVVKSYQSDDFMIIALGGIITNQQIDDIKDTNVNGFASIRYFSS
ncbi:MAG: thiamine phosphate synthase, partial [Campylobacterota bacterium]|nr:thiamine phosphate synthase [Campylobacterota bacterium]